MTARSKKPAKPAEPKEALKATIEKARTVLAKHAAKPANDPKRRLAHKKLKRAQRGLRKLVTMEAKAAQAAEKQEGGG